MDFTTFSRTHQGQVRQLNEDSVHIEERTQKEGGELLVVADGMGGHQSGEVASQQAIETIKMVYYQQVAHHNPPTALKLAIEEANQIIYQRAQQENRSGMGTTVVAAVRLNDFLHYAHVGDSRLYLVRNNQIQQLTHDHSLVAEQVAAGILTKEEAQNHPHRNVISRAVGTSPRVHVDLGQQPIKLEDGDALILCSDGLTEHVKADRILQLIRGRIPEEATQELIKAANAGGGSDNISVIVLRVGKPKSATVPRASAVMTAPIQERAQTGVQPSPVKAAPSRQAKQKKKGGFMLPAALGVAVLLLLVIIGGGLWSILGGGGSETDSAVQPTTGEETAAAAADDGSSEEESQGESDNSPASTAEILPTATELPTSTTLPGEPTSTRRPTYTPPPSLTPVPPSATPPPMTATSAQAEVAPSATQAAAQAANTPVPARESQPLAATSTQAPKATQPAATQPAATQPAATQPAATQPAPTQPPAPTAPTEPAFTIPDLGPTATLPPVATVTPPPTTPPLPTFTPIPTTPPLPSNTPIPPAPTSYDSGPVAVEPKEGASFQSENVTFKWDWNGPALAGGQQFRVMGFRDGKWENLATAPPANRTVQVWMKAFGNFETQWQWYVVVIDSGGNEISPRSATWNFGISLPDDGDDDGGTKTPIDR